MAAPTVTTQAVTSIDEITAMGNGNVTATGGLTVTKRGICWKTTSGPTVDDSTAEDSGSFAVGAFNKAITGLTRGQIYYVKAYAYNTDGYGYGAEVTFYTYPAATTQTPSGINRIDPTAVTANGLIAFGGTESITTRGFKYGLTETDTWTNSETGTYTEGTFTRSISGLSNDTTYYIRAYAVGNWGTKYGSYLQFKTAYPYGSYRVNIRAVATASDVDIDEVGGKISLTIENHLIQNQTVADLVAASYLAEYKDQKTKLVTNRLAPMPYIIGDTIRREGQTTLYYYLSTCAKINYAAAANAIYPYGYAARDMIIRKINVTFNAGDYSGSIELES